MTKHYIDRKLVNENVALPTSTCSCSVNSEKSGNNMLFILILIALAVMATYFIMKNKI
jgi:hypothetical protein